MASGKSVSRGLSGDTMAKISLLIFAVAAVLVILYIISRLSTTSSLTILAIIILSTMAAVWYNYMANRSVMARA